MAGLLIECMRAIAVLAEQPDFQPVVAGRRWKPSESDVAADMEAARRRRAGKT